MRFDVNKDFRMVHVSYKGMPQVITEIIGGRLQLVSDNVTSVLPHVTAVNRV